MNDGGVPTDPAPVSGKAAAGQPGAEASLLLKSVDLTRVFASISRQWEPLIAGELNGQHVKCVKCAGEFVWHKHDEEDELFLVHRGAFQMRLRGGVVTIGPGQFFIVPRGVEHQPFAAEEAEVVLFEPTSTVNTGNLRNHLTRERLGRFDA